VSSSLEKNSPLLSLNLTFTDQNQKFSHILVSLSKKILCRCLRQNQTVKKIPYELVNEKEKYKNIADEMDQTFAELAGY